MLSSGTSHATRAGGVAAAPVRAEHAARLAGLAGLVANHVAKLPVWDGWIFAAKPIRQAMGHVDDTCNAVTAMAGLMRFRQRLARDRRH